MKQHKGHIALVLWMTPCVSDSTIGAHYSVLRSMPLPEPKRTKQPMRMNRPSEQSIYMLTIGMKSVLEDCTGQHGKDLLVAGLHEDEAGHNKRGHL